MEITYMIVMPSKYNSEEIILDDGFRDTIFYRFNKNIANSYEVLKFITYLPCSLYELIEEWPSSSINIENESKYNIQYIYDSPINDIFKKIINEIKIGCIFVMHGVEQITEKMLLDIANVPIISLRDAPIENTLPLKNSSVKKIFDMWYLYLKEHSYSIDLNNKLYDKTSFKGIEFPGISFLNPLSSTINRIRGLYFSQNKSIYDDIPMNIENHDEKEEAANILILDALKHILVEKYLLLVLQYLKDDIIDDFDLQLLNSVGLSIDALKAIVNSEGLENPNFHNYEEAVHVIKENFDKLTFFTDLTLCIPSMNYYMLEAINTDLLKKASIPKKILRHFYDNDGYYDVFDTDMFSSSNFEKESLNFLIFNLLSRDYALEKKLISQLYLLMTLSKRDPFIRTKNVPTSYLQSKVSEIVSMNKHNKDVSKINQRFDEISDIIKNSLSEEIWKVITKNTRHLTVLSDLPVEWVKIKGVPLCALKEISRRPLSPGNNIIQFNYFDKEIYIPRDKVCVLVLNVLSKDDSLYELGKEIDNYINENNFAFDICYQEPSSKEEFIKIITEKKPTILIYYGHGSYNIKKGERFNSIGKLLINNDELTAIELEGIPYKPPVAILCACETNVARGNYLNIANLFLSFGTLAVLGTYFEIEGSSGFNIITSFLLQFSMNFNTGSSFNISRIFSMVFRELYIIEPLISIFNVRTKTNKTVDFNDFIYGYLKKYMEYCKNNLSSVDDTLYNREVIYFEIFKDDKDTMSIYTKLVDNKRIFPESLFYMVLGSPEKINIT